MDFTPRVRLALVLGVAFILWCLSGCGGGDAPVMEGDPPILKLGQLYMNYARATGKSPGSPQQLRDYYEKLSKQTKDEMGTWEQISVSPRDNQPYVIRCNLELPPMGMGGKPPMMSKKPGVGPPKSSAGIILAHEQEGLRGKKWVVVFMGTPIEMESSVLDGMLSQGQ